MSLFVALMGVLFLGIGSTVLAVPAAGRRALKNFVRRDLMPVFSIVRVGIGIAFVLAAPSTRLPGFVWALGLLLIVSGIGLQVVGFDRLRKWTDWWMEKPDGEFRGWSLLGILMGALLIWAAV